jgi:hypothetical protein
VLGKLCERSVGNGPGATRREVTTSIVKRDDTAGRVDPPRVFIARGVAVVERVVAIPIRVRNLASRNGGAQDKWCREEDAFIRVVNFHRG